MSALGLSVDSTNYSAYADTAFPYLSSFAGVYYFGGSQALSVQNLVPGATVNMTPTGTGTYGKGYVELTYLSSYFSSGINISQGHTIIIVATTEGSGEYYASAGVGVLLGMSGSGSTQLRYSSGFGPTCIATSEPGALYGFMAGSSPGVTGQPFNLYIGKSGALTKTTNGSLGANLPSSQVIIGPSGQFVGGGTHRQAFAAISDNELTEAQILEIYQYLRGKLMTRGIFVA